MNKSRGFTLLEILLVVGIIAILAGIVIVALNPTKQFAQVRNTQRKANLSELNKALYQYYIDNSRYPTSVTTTLTEICDTEATSTGHSLNCTNKIDLSYLVPTYLVAIPTDPQASGTSTGYLVAKNTANKIHLKADNAELAQTTTIGDSSGVLPDHLVSYWSFDGNALDSVGGNNGTVVGATATNGVRGVASTAYAFAGGGASIDVADNSILDLNLTDFSISFWIKTSQVDFSYVITKAAGGGSNGWGVAMNPSRSLYCEIYPAGGSRRTQAYSLPDNQWTYINCSVDRQGNLEIFANGISRGTSDISSIGSLGLETTLPLAIGSTFTHSYSLNGSLDNVRIYNKALTAEEVLNIYNTEKP